MYSGILLLQGEVAEPGVSSIPLHHSKRLGLYTKTSRCACCFFRIAGDPVSLLHISVLRCGRAQMYEDVRRRMGTSNCSRQGTECPACGAGPSVCSITG